MTRLEDVADEIVELRKENARLTRTLQKLSDYYELHGSWDTFKRQEILSWAEQGGNK